MVFRWVRLLVFSLLTLFLTHCGKDNGVTENGNVMAPLHPPRVDLAPGAQMPVGTTFTNLPGAPGRKPSSVAEIKTWKFRARTTLAYTFLFVVDNSDSMADKTPVLLSALGSFFARLARRHPIDVQAAVTLSDAYFMETCASAPAGDPACSLFDGFLLRNPSGPTVVAGNNPASVAASLSSLVSRVPLTPAGNTDYEGWEEGLRAMEDALSGEAGRIDRAGTPTIVLSFSDSDDQSCPVGTGYEACDAAHETPTTHFADFLRRRATPTILYPFLGRAGSCPTLESAGTRWLDLLSLTQAGFEGAICPGALGASLVDLAARLEARGACYPLPSEAAGKKLQVVVDGATLSPDPRTGFYVESATGSLCFASPVEPAEGASVQVTYVVGG